jgi:hypothetical protein
MSALHSVFKDYPDIAYLLRDSVSVTLSQAATKTFIEKPIDPIEFFAKLLLHQIKVDEKVRQVSLLFKIMVLLGSG